MTNLTQDYLKSIFSYSDGCLFWKHSRANNKIKSGSLAGDFHKKTGYYRVFIDKKRYKLHNIIFLFHHGYLPDIVDHIDGNSKNNRIENLRPATKQQNNCNQKIRKDNSSGWKGISIYNDKNYIHAQIQHMGKKMHKCYFPINDYNLSLAKNWISETRNALHKEFSNSGKAHD